LHYRFGLAALTARDGDFVGPYSNAIGILRALGTDSVEIGDGEKHFEKVELAVRMARCLSYIYIRDYSNLAGQATGGGGPDHYSWMERVVGKVTVAAGQRKPVEAEIHSSNSRTPKGERRY
jgi:hypothetical protein